MKSINAKLKEVWIKHKNPFCPEDPPEYPSRVTIFEEIKIDGKKMTFRIVIEKIDTKTGLKCH